MCSHSDQQLVKHRLVAFYSAGMINTFGQIPISIVKGGPQDSTTTYVHVNATCACTTTMIRKYILVHVYVLWQYHCEYTMKLLFKDTSEMQHLF
jgi:hypothetical protein